MGQSDNISSNENPFALKKVLTFLGVICVAYIGYLGIRSEIEMPIQLTPTNVPSPAISLPARNTATVASTTTVTPTRTLYPTSTLTPLPTWVTNFSDPILESIKDRKPDFEDDFSTNTQRWHSSPNSMKGITIEDGVMRLQGDIHVSNSYFLYKPNIVLQVDILDPVTSYSIVVLSSPTSPYNTFGDIQLDSNHGWIVWGEYYAVSARGQYSSDGQKTCVTIIIKDSRVAYYLNGAPLTYYENPKFLSDEVHQRRFVCGGDGNICYFDNVKVWNLDNSTNQP